MQDHGVIHKRTCPYTPQQNGVVERKHRHIIQVARALLHHSHLPQRFWGEAILTATHLINRLPSAVINWQCPFEILTAKVPNYDHLRVFGCLCYATNLDPHRKKFDSRARKSIYLGYVPNCKGFKVYDLQTRKVFVSRDVIFYEHTFPYKLLPTDESNDVPLPLTITDDHPIPKSVHTNNPQSPVITDNVEIRHQDALPTDADPDEHTDPITDIVVHEPRRSTRDRRPPAWLESYVTCAVNKPTIYTPNAYPYTALPNFSTTYVQSLCAMSQYREPQTYHEAKDKIEWQEAMQQELNALKCNKTWELVDLPKHKRTIGCKWVYKVKLKADGTVERHKARLVAKGYSQIDGVDFYDSFSPIAKNVTVRIFLALAAHHNWFLHQFDVSNAFLHGFLDEEVYMIPPPGYPVADGQVCKLKRSLYGLRQASRQWNTEITKKLQAAGFTQSTHDYCLFTKGSRINFIALSKIWEELNFSLVLR